MSHWQMGSLSSWLPGPCSRKLGCDCSCHANGVEDLMLMLMKLSVGRHAIEARIDAWWGILPRNGGERDVY